MERTSEPVPDDVDVPPEYQRLLRYPNVALTDHQCPAPSCEKPLVFTGTRHEDIYDDEGFRVQHVEEATYECLNGHPHRGHPTQDAH